MTGLIKNKVLPLPSSPRLPLISTPLPYITVEAEPVPYLEVEGISKIIIKVLTSLVSSGSELWPFHYLLKGKDVDKC